MENTEIDLGILLLYYTFSDQYGEVDMPLAKQWAMAQFGIEIKDDYFYVEQHHLNLLMDKEIIPDIRPMLSPYCKIS